MSLKSRKSGGVLAVKYVILTDAACDLDPGVLKTADLAVIPMEYIQQQETRTYDPAENCDLKSFYDAQRNGDLTKTSQIAPRTYEKVMRAWMDQGYSILYLALSGGLSSTCQTACMAGEKLHVLYPYLQVIALDTKAATGGMGILVERAVRNREKGMSLSDNAKDLMDAVERLHHWFMVQDLKYLQRGGRVSAAAAAVGTVFQVRPLLKIDEKGKLQTIGKARGTKKAVGELLERYEENRTEDTEDPVYIIDADAPDTGDALEEKLRALHPELTIRRCTLSPIIGSHTGPGMAAIIHIGKAADMEA